MKFSFMSENSCSIQEDIIKVNQAAEYETANTHIKRLIKQTREANINKYLEDSSCCDVCDSIQLSNSQTQARISLESCEVLEE